MLCSVGANGAFVRRTATSSSTGSSVGRNSRVTGKIGAGRARTHAQRRGYGDQYQSAYSINNDKSADKRSGSKPFHSSASRHATGSNNGPARSRKFTKQALTMKYVHPKSTAVASSTVDPQNKDTSNVLPGDAKNNMELTQFNRKLNKERRVERRQRNQKEGGAATSAARGNFDFLDHGRSDVVPNIVITDLEGGTKRRLRDICAGKICVVDFWITSGHASSLVSFDA